MPYQVGQRVGDYEIQRILGAGGMGEVYQVRNVISDRTDAMKVLLPDLEDNPELADRFLREIKVQARLSHPNIAALFTAFRHEGKLLMVMEYIEGVSLEQRLDRGPLPPAEAVNYVRQVLAALAFAHSKGVVHRDITPANMMLGRDGVVKLMDFGIARMKEDRKLTQTGQTVGSLYYMSPEQIRGGELDGRSDVYSLGISLYELVTGRRPYDGVSDFAIMAAHMKENPVPPIRLDPTLPPLLNEVILKAIAKEPSNRFQSAEAFAGALGNAAVENANAVTQRPVLQPVVSPLAAAPAPPPTHPESGSRRGLYMALGSLTTVAVLGLLVFQVPKWFQAGAAAPAPAPRPAAPIAQPVAPQPQTPAQQPPDLIRKNLPEPIGKAAVKKAPGHELAAQTPRPEPPAPVPQAQPQQPAPQPVPSAPPAQPAAQAADPARADTALLDALEDRLSKLAIRVNTLQDKIRGIAQQQAAQGVRMRTDVESAQSLTNYLMDEAEKRLRSGDAARAKASLEKAERQIEALERILGI